VFEPAEALAMGLGISRSNLFATALAEFIASLATVGRCSSHSTAM